jgi:protein-L-isoaspartate(D-aspartate) O-methyltransferase
MALSLEDAKRAYAEEIRAVAAIQCDRLIEAFARVPREAFLGPRPWSIATGSRIRRFKMPAPDERDWDYRATPDADPPHLYHNILIGIDPKRSLNNGQPTGVAGWFDTLEPHLVDVAVLDDPRGAALRSIRA